MRPIPADVRAVIVCPRCRGELADDSNGFRCDACRLRYRRERGIPVLLVDEAEPIDGPGDAPG